MATAKKSATKRTQNLNSIPAGEMNDESSEMSSARPSRVRNSTSEAPAISNKAGMLKDLIANPAVRYVAGGIATALITRVVTNMSTRYPEISNFLKENMDVIEGKLGEFKNNLDSNNSNSSSSLS